MANSLNLDPNTDPLSIDWLNLRVFLQVALIYLCLHVTTVAFCIGVNLIEVNPIKCEHPFQEISRVVSNQWLRDRGCLDHSDNVLRPVVIFGDSDAMSSVKQRCTHRSKYD